MSTKQKHRGRYNSCTVILIQSAGELVDGRRNLQALVQNSTLSLNADILRPFNKTGQITSGLDVLTDAKVTSAPLKESGETGLSFLCSGDSSLAVRS